MSYRIPKGKARLAVEAVLSNATEGAPMTAQQVSDISGVEINLARAHIGNCVHHGLAYNLNAGHRGACGLYVWGKRETCAEPVPNVAQPRERVTTGLYAGLRAIPVRSGSDQFLRCPSLHNGQAVEWRRPLIIGMGKEVRV